MPMEELHGSGNQVEQPFLASFASAFKFQPTPEGPSEDTVGRAQASETKELSQGDSVLDGPSKRGKGRKRAERNGGVEWGKSKERLKIARIESDVRKVRK